MTVPCPSYAAARGRIEMLGPLREIIEFSDVLVHDGCKEVEFLCAAVIAELETRPLDAQSIHKVIQMVNDIRGKTKHIRECVREDADYATRLADPPLPRGGGGRIILLLKTSFKTITKGKTQGLNSPFFSAAA